MSNHSPLSKNKYTYGTLLNCYCMGTMEHKALELFEKMDQMGFVSNSLPFTSIMSMYMKLGKPEKSYASFNDIVGVERVLDEIEKVDEDKSDWTIYSNLVAIYVKAGPFEKAKIALGKLEEKKMKPGTPLYPRVTNIGYLVILRALAKLNDVEGLMKYFEEWESGCTYYDMKLADTAIVAYLLRDKFKEAKLVFENANKRSKGPFFKAREKFMFFFLKNRQVDLALSYLDANVSEAKDERWHPSWALVAAFLNYIEEGKDVHTAENVLDVMRPFHCLSSNDYQSLLKVYIAAGKFAPEMHRRLEEDGIEISCENEELLQRVCPRQDYVGEMVLEMYNQGGESMAITSASE
ncbi:Tetratricopeptide-like helical domain containing protein, partial [Trema orientale]